MLKINLATTTLTAGSAPATAQVRRMIGRQLTVDPSTLGGGRVG